MLLYYNGKQKQIYLLFWSFADIIVKYTILKIKMLLKISGSATASVQSRPSV